MVLGGRRAVAALVLAACGQGNGSPSPCSGDVSPALAACVRGRTFADCGGTGPPRLACRVGSSGGECLWFVTSCVAEEFIASECAEDAVCCVSDWPYAATGTAFTCEGTPPVSGGQNPCSTGAKAKPSCARFGRWLSFDLAPRTDLFGWTVWVEIDTARTPLAARACASSFTDARQLMCMRLREPVCATSGHLTMNAVPTDATGLAGLALRLDVTIGELRLRAEL